MIPGKILYGDVPIVLNAGKRPAELPVANESDRVVQVGSHYPFAQVNRRLVFDRSVASGMHLDIPAGDVVRWSAYETRQVRLIPFSGSAATVTLDVAGPNMM